MKPGEWSRIFDGHFFKSGLNDNIINLILWAFCAETITITTCSGNKKPLYPLKSFPGLFMEILKVIISPLNFIIILFFAGCVLIVLNKKQKLAIIILIFSLCCFYLFSFRPFSNFLVWSLEKNYSPIDDFSHYQQIENIVLLTGWDSDNPEVPYTSNIGYRSALRTLEAHRIFTQLQQCQIIISGRPESTKLMRTLLVLLGVPEKKIILDNTYFVIHSMCRVGFSPRGCLKKIEALNGR